MKDDIVYIKSILDIIEEVDYHRNQSGAEKKTIDRAVAFDNYK